MNEELAEFLRRNRACAGGIRRLENLGAETLEQAWDKASPTDLVWAVTRPGVMSSDQRRRFLAEAVLAPIEHLLTDEGSLIILRKLRTNERVTQEDKDAARAAAEAAWAAADAACSAACAASDAACSAACAAAESWAYAAYAAASSAADAACAAAADAAAREKQARWIRTNFKLADLRTN